VVFEERLEVFLAVRGEEESVNFGTEFLECAVRGCEKCSARVRGFEDFGEEAGLHEAELEGAEFAGEERDYFQAGRWREENGIDCVNDAIGAKLRMLVVEWRKGETTYDVDGNDFAVKIYSNTFEAYADAKTLSTEGFLEGCWDGVRNENAAGWVEFWRDVVCENFLNELF